MSAPGRCWATPCPDGRICVAPVPPPSYWGNHQISSPVSWSPDHEVRPLCLLQRQFLSHRTHPSSCSHRPCLLNSRVVTCMISNWGTVSSGTPRALTPGRVRPQSSRTADSLTVLPPAPLSAAGRDPQNTHLLPERQTFGPHTVSSVRLHFPFRSSIVWL